MVKGIGSYIVVYLILMSLLLMTLGVAYVRVGGINTLLALGIAGAKAILVVLYFMHIRKSDTLTKVVAAAGVFWLGILIFFSLNDYFTRGWLLLPGKWPSALSRQTTESPD